MEPILLYGFPAGSSMGLVAALEWLGKPYSLCRVDMLGEMRDASYARINARHETPVLITEPGADRDDGDRRLARGKRQRATHQLRAAVAGSRPHAPADRLC